MFNTNVEKDNIINSLNKINSQESLKNNRDYCWSSVKGRIKRLSKI